MVTVFAFNTDKAVIQDAAIEVAVDNLSDIGPEDAMLPCKALSPHTGYQGGGMISSIPSVHEVIEEMAKRKWGNM